MPGFTRINITPTKKLENILSKFNDNPNGFMFEVVRMNRYEPDGFVARINALGATEGDAKVSEVSEVFNTGAPVRGERFRVALQGRLNAAQSAFLKEFAETAYMRQEGYSLNPNAPRNGRSFDAPGLAGNDSNWNSTPSFTSF